MTPTSRERSQRLLPLAILLPTAALISAGPAAAAVPGDGTAFEKERPTIVLVHGAWADASGWNKITERLQQAGFPVIAAANPLRSLSGDSAYLAARLKTIKGPIVLVGHSYGGSVITNAATGNPNVRSLVYISAFQPDAGETALQLATKYPGSRLSDDPDAPLPTSLDAVPIPGPGDPSENIDVYLKPEKFREVFLSNRLDANTAAVLAASQRPATSSAFAEPSKTPAWKTIPSWALVATEDYTIGAENERFMAKRAKSQTIEVDAPHAAYLTNPGAVTELILRAAEPEPGKKTPSLAKTGPSEQSAVLAGVSVLAVLSGAAMFMFSRRARASG